MFDTVIKQAQQSSLVLASMPHTERCQIIQEIATAINNNTETILAENKKDLDSAIENNIDKALLDRLKLDASRLEAMTNGMSQIITLNDPLKVESQHTHDNGMEIIKKRVPLGVLLVVYEARPNVSTDTVALALKTGNAVILKGSRQTKYSNSILGNIIKEVLEKYNLQDAVLFYPDLTHEKSAELISSEYIDIIIPRGGEKLKSVVKKLAKAPVLGAGGGTCHTYISQYADINKAKNIIHNAKTQRPSVCNSLETVLIDSSLINKKSLDNILELLIQDNVIFYVDSNIKSIYSDNNNFIPIEDSNNNFWHTEHLDLKISLKTVNNTQEAINHINTYSTGHSDCIISENTQEIDLFSNLVDSSCVYSNASIRFTDGEVFGFGAEIGISTQKLHARGPIGTHELTSYKYIIQGTGQIR